MGHNDNSFFAKTKGKIVGGDRIGPTPSDFSSLEGFPSIAAMLTAIHPEAKGESRRGGSILVFWGPEGLTVRLCVPSMGITAFRVVESLDTILTWVESKLTGDEIEWRKDRQKQGKS